MTAYSWPGNVRELQNLVHSLVITLSGPLISPRDLPPQISGAPREASCYTEDILAARRPLRDIMRGRCCFYENIGRGDNPVVFTPDVL